MSLKAAWIGIALAACTPQGNGTGETPTARPTSATASSPAQSASASPGASALSPGIPPRDVACTADAECTALDLTLDETNWRCCSRCTRYPASARWASQLNAFCAKHRDPNGCPTIDCPPESTKPKCESGVCVLK